MRRGGENTNGLFGCLWHVWERWCEGGSRCEGLWVSARRPGTELGGRDAEGLAVVELVALSKSALAAFPLADVVAHAVDAGQGVVARGAAGLDELAGHLPPAPAAGLALLA